MADLVLYIAIMLVSLSATVAVFGFAYELGVRHTEERWSDAVNRKNDRP